MPSSLVQALPTSALIIVFAGSIRLVLDFSLVPLVQNSTNIASECVFLIFPAPKGRDPFRGGCTDRPTYRPTEIHQRNISWPHIYRYPAVRVPIDSASLLTFSSRSYREPPMLLFNTWYTSCRAPPTIFFYARACLTWGSSLRARPFQRFVRLLNSLAFQSGSSCTVGLVEEGSTLVGFPGDDVCVDKFA